MAALNQNQPLSYEDWLAKQGTAYQGDDTGGTAPGIAYREYLKPFQDMALDDPSLLPPGFLQSEWGPAYQANLALRGDPATLNWLRQAPIQFSAGRSMADFAKPTTSGQFGGVDPADIGMDALGGFGGAAMCAWVSGCVGA